MARKKRKFKIDTSTIFMLVISIIIVIALIIKPDLISIMKKPFTTVSILPVPEPISTEECKKLGGIMILPEQDCSKDYISWGYGIINGEKRQCCVPDYCESSGGKKVTSYINETKKFERSCVCPVPKVYKTQSGCTQEYK